MTPAAQPEPPTTTLAGNFLHHGYLADERLYRAFGQRKDARSMYAFELTEPLPWQYAAHMGAGHTSS